MAGSMSGMTMFRSRSAKRDGEAGLLAASARYQAILDGGQRRGQEHRVTRNIDRFDCDAAFPARERRPDRLRDARMRGRVVWLEQKVTQSGAEVGQHDAFA